MPASRPCSTPRARSVHRLVAILAAAAAPSFAAAQTGPVPQRAVPRPPLPIVAEVVQNSQLDAALFYQLLLGEMEMQQGEAGAAYQLLLDAARRTRSEELFRRATDIALQGRAGEQALAAVVGWRDALPQSAEAMRYQVQLLVALNRLGEAEAPLIALLEQAPQPALPALIEAVPRFLARSTDRPGVASLVERSLKPWTTQPATRVAALVASGRAWLTAGDSAKALQFAQRASVADPGAPAPALLALDLLPGTPAAEAIVKRQLEAKPAAIDLRLLYIRSLALSQRVAEAATQIAVVTAAKPELAPPWLTRGALELELRHPKPAIEALQTYVRLVEAGAPVTLGNTPNGAEDDDVAPTSVATGLTQAWLLLAQAAEQQQDYPGAERWLAKIDNPQRALDVQVRRASLLARQGKLREARELIRRVPEQSADDARAKLLAEATLLRERKQWSDAEKVMVDANKRFPNDSDLLYEHAMIDEKLDRLDDMERLLRKVIELKPETAHAYNALGYSLADRKIRLPEARTLIQKALTLSPGEPFITDSLGWVEYRLGNRDEAIRLLRGAYQSRPDPEIAAHLGEVLWSNGQADEARRVWREGKARDSSNDVLRETLARLRVDL